MKIRAARRGSACRGFRSSSSSRTASSAAAWSAPCRSHRSSRPLRSISAEAAVQGELGTFSRKVAIVAAVVIALLLLWRVREVLILVFIAAVVAAGIEPAVQRVRIYGRYWFHRNIPRGAAVFIVYFPFVIGVVLLALIGVPRIVDQLRVLAAQLPVLIEKD